MTRERKVTIRIQPDLLRQMDEFAAGHGIASRSELARLAICKAIGQEASE